MLTDRMFYGNVNETWKDQPGKYALVYYTLGCNLKCYGCHNYDELNTGKAKGINIQELTSKYPPLEEVYDMLIICGGEPTIWGDMLLGAIDEIKKEFDIPIRVDTNGTNPEMVRKLKHLVDGFAMDIKIPFWDKEKVLREKEKWERVIGVRISVSLLEKMRESFEEILSFIKEKGADYSLFRTVEYPILEKKDFEFLSDYMNEISRKYEVFYSINPFFSFNSNVDNDEILSIPENRV